MTKIAELLNRNLEQPIAEVVKVNQTDDHTVREEITEYVATPRIKQEYVKVLSLMADKGPTDRVGVWVSGFFGSGKSSFIKILGYLLAQRSVMGEPARALFQSQLLEDTPNDPQTHKIVNTLDFLNARPPMLVLMFDVQVDLPVGMAGDPLARVMYRNLLRALDYEHEDYDVAELEIELEQEGRLADFLRLCAAHYGDVARGRPAPPPPTVSGITAEEYGVWRAVREGPSRLERIGRLLHEMDPATYPAISTWAAGARRAPDLTVGLLVRRTFELTARRRPGHGVAFVMDEVGQYVAHSTARLENLRAIVEQFGQESKARVDRLRDRAPSPVWVIISSQEKLDEVVSAIGDRRVEIAKVQDRFPTQIDMAPADIRLVATRRVLGKNERGHKELGQLYDQRGALLKTHTRLERTGRPHDVARHDFIDFYPYLPHLIDLSIDVISGIRGRGEAPRHVGGSNRTLIKQAYEMLAGPRTALKDKTVGELVTLDRIYDLVEGNLPTETRQGIDAIDQTSDAGRQWPLRVAKALALLEHARDLPRTEVNVAALLYRRLGDDSPLEEVRAALQWLHERQFIGQTESGWKLLSVAEKNWETERSAYRPTPREQNEILHAALGELFKTPALSAHRYNNQRTLRVRAEWNGRTLTTGDHISLRLRMAEEPAALAAELERAEADSRAEPPPKHLYWIIVRDDAIDKAVLEIAQSAYMVNKYENLKNQNRLQPSESASLDEEKRGRDTHIGRLRHVLSETLAAGRGVFAGVRRNGSDFGTTTEDVMRGFYAFAVPDLYPKLEMGLRPDLKDDAAEAILKASNLNGLPAIYYDSANGFALVRKGDGDRYVVNPDAPLIREIRDYITQQSNYGNKVTGKGLEEHFGRPPYGWEQRALLPALAAMLRGGLLVVTYQGRRYSDHLEPQVRDAFAGASAFRAASFAPRTSVDLPTLVKATRHYEGLTGRTVDIEETAIAAAYKELAAQAIDRLRAADAVIRANDMPGLETLSEYGEMLEGLRQDPSDDVVKRMAQEGHTFREVRDRAERIAAGIDDRGITRLRRLRAAAKTLWPALRAEGIDEPELAGAAEALRDNTAGESFYDFEPEVDRALALLEGHYGALYDERHAARAAAYTEAVDVVRGQPDWAAIGGVDGLLLRPLAGRDHDADRPDGAAVCRVCGASLAGLAADLAGVERLRADALAQLRIAAAPEMPVKRLRLADVIGPSPVLTTSGDVDTLLARLRDELQALVEAGVQVILE